MPLLFDQYNLLLDDSEFSEDAEYYLASKVQASYFIGRFQESISKWMEDSARVTRSRAHYKEYPGFPSIPLKPNLRRFQKLNWERTVLQRRSARNLDGRPVTYAELSNLIRLSFGLKEKGKWRDHAPAEASELRRALPSGGALYPLELYALALNVTGLEPGLYHYGAKTSSLSLIRSDSKVFELDRFWAQRELFGKPAVIFYLSSVFERSRAKYGPRALRFILLEAGGIGTHLNLTANAMGIDFCFDGGGFESRIEEVLGIDGIREGLITSFVLGHSSSKDL